MCVSKRWLLIQYYNSYHSLPQFSIHGSTMSYIIPISYPQAYQLLWLITNLSRWMTRSSCGSLSTLLLLVFYSTMHSSSHITNYIIKSTSSIHQHWCLDHTKLKMQFFVSELVSHNNFFTVGHHHPTYVTTLKTAITCTTVWDPPPQNLRYVHMAQLCCPT